MKLAFLSKRRPRLPERTIDEIKQLCRITFIDDKTFAIIELLKRDGWKKVTHIRDVDGLGQIEVRDAHILVVDIQGVGKKLKLTNEGLGLIKALREQYPNKKIIAYSAEDQGQIRAFNEYLELADARLSKNANSYEFIFKIEKYSKQIFSRDEFLLRVKELLINEYGRNAETNEIIDKLTKIKKRGAFDQISIENIFNLQNAANLASVIQLFFNGK